LPYICSLTVSAAAHNSSGVDSSGNENVYKITSNLSGFVSVCKAKQKEVLGSGCQDEDISLLELYVNW